MKKDSCIYVAGHRGMVGSAIVRRLKTDGYIRVVTRTRKELDLTRQDQVEEFFERIKPEYVFLAAAKVGGIWANFSQPAEFIRDNLMIQTNIIHAAWKSDVRKLLFLGSSCIYPRECPQPIKEEYLMTGPLESTNSPYAVAKISGIEMCWSYNRQYGTHFIPVMPTNLYGPYDNYDLKTSHVLPALIRKFHLAKMAGQGDWEAIAQDSDVFGGMDDNFLERLTGTKHIGELGGAEMKGIEKPTVTLWGTGSPRREFLHVDDLADACLHIMAQYQADDLINIGMGKDITIKELAGLVADGIGFKGRVQFDSSKPDGTPQKLLDVSRLTDLGWTAGIDLEQGIEMTYQWYSDHLNL